MQALHIQVKYTLSRPCLSRFQSVVPFTSVITLLHLSYTNAETGISTKTISGHCRAVQCATSQPTGVYLKHRGLPLTTALQRAFYTYTAAGYVLTDSSVNRTDQQMCNAYYRWLSTSSSFSEPIKLDIMPIL